MTKEDLPDHLVYAIVTLASEHKPPGTKVLGHRPREKISVQTLCAKNEQNPQTSSPVI